LPNLGLKRNRPGRTPEQARRLRSSHCLGTEMMTIVSNLRNLLMN